MSDGEGLACIPAEWSSRHREEALRSPGLWPYLVWVVRDASKSTVKVCGCGEEQSCLLLTPANLRAAREVQKEKGMVEDEVVE